MCFTGGTPLWSLSGGLHAFLDEQFPDAASLRRQADPDAAAPALRGADLPLLLHVAAGPSELHCERDQAARFELYTS